MPRPMCSRSSGWSPGGPWSRWHRRWERAEWRTPFAWWGTWTGAAFLKGYLADEPSEVLPDTRTETSRLLDAYILEKSLYELTYELDNRPDWVDIPLRGILTQLSSPA